MKFIAKKNIACFYVIMETHCVSCKKYTGNENSLEQPNKID